MKALLLLLLLGCCPLWGVVSYETSAKPVQHSVQMSLSTSITLKGSANQAVMVFVGFSPGGASGANVTVGGSPAFLVPGSDSGTSDSNVESAIYCVAMGSTKGKQTISLTWSPASLGILGAIAAADVNQTTPCNNGTFITGNLQAGSISLPITSNSGDLTSSFLIYAPAGATTNQTPIWSASLLSYVANGDIGPGTGTTTHVWSESTFNDVALSGANFVQQNCLAISPASQQVSFSTRAIGSLSSPVIVSVTNVCEQGALQIQSISLSPTEFKLVTGWAPITLNHKQELDYQLRFGPDAAQTFTGAFTINVEGDSPIVISLSGAGRLPSANPNWNTSALTFSSVPVGTTSAPQTAILTNTGTSSLALVSVYTDPPFTVTGFTPNTKLPPKQSLPLQVTFTPSFTGSYNGTLVVTSEGMPPTGVALTATAGPASSFSVSTFPTLPAATSGFSYISALQSADGVDPITWSLASGSNLPTGLSLGDDGTITGTVDPSVIAGSYPFTVTATDSNSPPDVATLQLTLPVGAPPGNSCNNDLWNEADTGTPLVPLTDLGTGTYYGLQGGLFDNGSNVMPASHDADGLSLAQSIQPLDAAGNPTPGGQYGMVSIGMSIAFDTFQVFVQDAAADPSVNPNLVFIPGAVPHGTAERWADPAFPGWSTILDFFLPQEGLTANQVVAAWVESADGAPTGSFPTDMTTLQAEYEATAQNLLTYFPNLKTVFFSSREYGGYSVSATGNPEPYAYESAFAVRGMIEDQMNGLPSMNYNPANGPVVAPWVGWGPYLWANGLLARSDGLVWSCQDFQSDGLHPQRTTGSEKDANMLMNFFKTTDVTAPWFLQTP